ncbi:MAG TPA: acetyl-CoA carboxylase carboxyl transferase subunit alpha, partial [Candidatus Ozemobacteraceae bacterium]|nr:acetyl-CoA carboxylase carboxyl transferase subunit alpha [Candidatus Ozemobacteraceae bacterium]
YSVYSVISAEGCAAILWKDAAKSKEAAVAMKMRANDLLEFGVIDDIIPEPTGGAHRDYDTIAANLKETINRHLPELLALSSDELIERRYRKYRSLGKFKDQQDMDDA